MDRNTFSIIILGLRQVSLSARRAWIEISILWGFYVLHKSLSARRAWIEIRFGATYLQRGIVALRKESVDRNSVSLTNDAGDAGVALRKESVDRNHWVSRFALFSWRSLSARRAWIEMPPAPRRTAN